jgi:1-acyl-sn-glycerol-3-phosphate acyltransferase
VSERYAGLPLSSRRHPPRALLSALRPVARVVIRRRVGVRVHGAENLPRKGPVIVACNHVGVADGPLLAIFGPRPVHALTKIEMFKGFLGHLLRAAGQIPVYRRGADPAAIKGCLRVLRDGRVLGIFPEGARGAGEFDRFHRGVAYLAMVTGAPVVPVVQFGTREPGAGNHTLPARGAVVDMVIGAPITLDAVPWPRTKGLVEKNSFVLREHLLEHLENAKDLTGRALPGPLPARDSDPDPATGVTDSGAA